MIGVFAKSGQDEAVREFFELFKTPWQFVRAGSFYDVVISTLDDVPPVDCRLLIVYGCSAKRVDAGHGDAFPLLKTASFIYSGGAVPIYCGVRTFAPLAEVVRYVSDNGETVGFYSRPRSLLRLGYDLFDESEYLLTAGQPGEWAHVPTLDLHIEILRNAILQAGIPLLEIPPSPENYSFITCLTHDIDFVGIRSHFFDHSMFGFCYRGTIGAFLKFLRGRLSLDLLIRSWVAVLSLPFVYAGWMKDFWQPFEWYLTAEKDLPSTYFLIPFKRTRGTKVSGANAGRRAAAYDVGDLKSWIERLQNEGCEVAVHGIDSWHSEQKARNESKRVRDAAGRSRVGVRMHWLLADRDTPAILDRADYDYDSTCGYNGAIGYRAGTLQVFRPIGTKKLLELPLHLQDGALFFPEKLNLSEPEAEQRCATLIDQARNLGGVLTVLWHDRSHAAERFWGDFYLRLLKRLRTCRCWFASAEQVIAWFRYRREVKFKSLTAAVPNLVSIHYDGRTPIQPLVTLRIHRPSGQRVGSASEHAAPAFEDISWDGEDSEKLSRICRERLGCFSMDPTVRA